MNRRLLTQLIRSGLTCLLIPSAVACASSLLRKEAAAYRAEGKAAQQHGDLVEALAFYRKAAALDPSSPGPHNDIGCILQREGRWQEAEQAFLRALAIDSDHAQTHANLARLHEQIGDEEQASSYWAKANQLADPQDSWKAEAQEQSSGTPRRRRDVVEEELRAHTESVQELSSVSGATAPDAQPAPSSSNARQEAVEEEFRAHTDSINEFRAVTEQHRDWP